MKKIPLLVLLVALFVQSCQDNEVTPEVKQSPEPAARSLARPTNGQRLKDPYHSIASDGSVVSIASTLAVEELYISWENEMWAVDNGTGYASAVNTDEPWVHAMASTSGYVFVIFDNNNFPNNRRLNKLDVNTGIYTDLTPGSYWPDSYIMAATGGFLYIVKSAQLYKVNASSGSITTLGTRNWSGAEAMTALGSYVYIVDDGLLWRVSTSTGSAATFGSGTWSGVPAMAASGSYIFAVDDGELWKVNVNDAAISTHGTGSWNATVAMTALNGTIYAVDGGELWKVSGGAGTISSLTPPGYTWAGNYVEMAARQ